MIYDKAYYITVNDKNFEKRQKLMDEQIKKYNLLINKYYGVNKDKINLKNLFNNKFLLNINNINNKDLGSLACYLSHIFLYIKIYKENKDNNKEVFLILEDDCVILSNFNKNLELYYKYVPENWDMIWLGFNNFYGTLINKYVGIPKLKSSVEFNLQHHCYLLKKKSIPKLLNILIPIYITKYKTQDNCLKQNFDKFNAYFISKKLAIQNININSTRTNNINGQLVI